MESLAADSPQSALPERDDSPPLKLASSYEPRGDQPEAIQELVTGLGQGEKDQVLLGVTGSGKTFTMAHVIERTQRPALILAPNKTLAAQLYGEFRSFFPENAVEYFVSYYDYYQPEAYVPRTDTYIEKESSINEQIERMRHSATRALFERRDVVIVASVSCIYGIGDASTYASMTFVLERGQRISRDDLCQRLISLQYKRNDIGFQRGTFRVRGDVVELWPAHLDDGAWRFSLFGDELDEIAEFDPLTGAKNATMKQVRVFANSHYVTPQPTLDQAIEQIKRDLKAQVEQFRSEGKLLEAERLEQRTQFDIEMMAATGSCPGIENYSRYLTGRQPGDPPPTLFEYLPEDALLFVDESHVMVPQLNGMYRGDLSRKRTLADYGFRLPACMDNRPLKFQEWNSLRPQTIFTSATPGNWELEQTGGVFTEQVVRPTGLIDPQVDVRPTENQVDDLLAECRKVIEAGHRILVTTLTKKMAEALTEYMHESGIKVRYIHSDVDTLERIEIIRDLRLGNIDVLVGINLLREGLDIPECGLVAVLDADKEGYLRSRIALIQTIGRAARNLDGRVLLYADRRTDSLQAAIDETQRRRAKQEAYNDKHGITPESVRKAIGDVMESPYERSDHVDVPVDPDSDGPQALSHDDIKARIEELEKQMRQAAADLEFEEAARLRDEIQKLEQADLGLATEPTSDKKPAKGSGKKGSAKSGGDSQDRKGQAKAKAKAKAKKTSRQRQNHGR